MRRILEIGCAVSLLAATAASGAAQDSNDAAAWFAMTFTPYGSLPPIATRAMAGLPRVDGAPGRALEVRYGRWSFDDQDDESFQTVGIGGRAGALGFVVGYETCDGCDGVIMLGIDFESVLSTQPVGASSASRLLIGLRPAFGAGVFTGEGNVYALSGTIDLPMSISVPAGTGGHFVPFLSPGVGVGRFGEGSGAETGIRASLGAGAGFITTTGVGIHLGWRKVFIEDGPSMLGLGLSWGR